MDIIFFNPPLTKRGLDLINSGFLWLASYLAKHGYKAKIFFLTNNIDKVIKEALHKYNPKYVAVGCKWYTGLYGAILTAKKVRKYSKSATLIAGGNTATFFDKDILKNSDFDIVVRGDAEVPLVNILSGNGDLSNCTVKENGKITRHQLNYTQNEKNTKGLRLGNLNSVLDDAEKLLSLRNFIWTGKGCALNCFYCSGGNRCQIDLFGRTKPVYRPIDDVLHDIKVLTKYSKDFLFDFGSAVESDEKYYSKLFKGISRRDLFCHFHCWQLPTTKFINEISRTFKRSIISLDTITLSENLRKLLSKKGLTKPFFSNKDLEMVIKCCHKKKNLFLEMQNITGLPYEKSCDLKCQVETGLYLVRKYQSIINVSSMPLSIEPGSLLYRNSKRYKMRSLRKGFNDFLDVTKNSFKKNISYPYNEFFLEKYKSLKLPHPYGVYHIGKDKKMAYKRANYFNDMLDKDLKANRGIWVYIMSKEEPQAWSAWNIED